MYSETTLGAGIKEHVSTLVCVAYDEGLQGHDDDPAQFKHKAWVHEGGGVAYMVIYIYMSIYVYIYIYIYLCIYIHTETLDTTNAYSMYVYIYIYIHIKPKP